MRLVKVDRNSNYAWDAERFRTNLAVDDVDAKGANVATFYVAYPVEKFKEYAEYARDGRYCRTPVSAVSDNLKCAEQKLLEDLASALKRGALVIWVFTEREPCGPELHNCRQILQDRLGDSLVVYYVHDYPSGVPRTNPIKRSTKEAIKQFGETVYKKVQDEIND
jgi:hypothetical protein